MKPPAVAAWFQRVCKILLLSSNAERLNQPPDMLLRVLSSFIFTVNGYQKQGKANKWPPANTAEAVNT